MTNGLSSSLDERRGSGHSVFIFIGGVVVALPAIISVTSQILAALAQ